MAVTHFGIVYATGSAHIRRYVYPSFSNAEIKAHPLQPGEAMAVCPNVHTMLSAPWHEAVRSAVMGAAGRAPGNPRCCVIDPLGDVVGVIMADAGIDQVEGMTLVNHAKAGIGWRWTAAGGFVAPPTPEIPLGMPGNRP